MSTFPHPATLLARGLTALAIAACAVCAASEPPAIAWNAQTLVAGASSAGATLTLLPEESDWAAATAVSATALPFWTPAGAQFRLHLEPSIRKAGSNLDGIVTVALITAPVVQRIQASDNIIGVTIAYKQDKGQAYFGFVRKEKAGPEGMRGTQYGDPQSFAGEQKLTAPSGPIDLTLTLTESAVSLSIPGVGDISAPHGLTRAAWDKAYPAVQVLHFGPGRCSATITKAGAGPK